MPDDGSGVTLRTSSRLQAEWPLADHECVQPAPDQDLDTWIENFGQRLAHPMSRAQVLAALGPQTVARLSPSAARRFGATIARVERAAVPNMHSLVRARTIHVATLVGFVGGVGETWPEGVRFIAATIRAPTAPPRSQCESTDSKRVFEIATELAESGQNTDRESSRTILRTLAEGGNDAAMERLIDDAVEVRDLSRDRWAGLLADTLPSLLEQMTIRDARHARQRIVDITGFTIDALWKLDGGAHIDRLLRSLKPWDLPLTVLVALLSATKRGAPGLSYRERFKSRAAERLRVAEPDQADAVLNMVG